MAEKQVLLSMLNPSEERLQRIRGSNTDTDPGLERWHQFLDHFSWLSDYQGGGKSVTSIAAEQTRSGCVFWLASNGGVDLTVLKYMRSVLDVLQEVALGTKDGAKAGARICTESIAFSRKRVASYRDRLFRVLESCKRLQRKKGMTLPQHQLLLILTLQQMLRHAETALMTTWKSYSVHEQAIRSYVLWPMNSEEAKLRQYCLI
jgi:hypothetical protein